MTAESDTYADARRLARAILDELPRQGGVPPSASVLALLLLLEHAPHAAAVPSATSADKVRALTVKQVRDALSIAQASTSALVAEALALGLVEPVRAWDRRLSAVTLTAKGLRLRRIRRGGVLGGCGSVEDVET